MTPPRVVTRGIGVGGRFRGASGTPPPTVCPGNGRWRKVAAGWGTPPYVWGDMETLWGLREHPFPGRRAVGAGHARPGGLRRQASMVRSVGRGLDPSAGGYPGDRCWREVSRGVGDAAPYGLPGEWAAAGGCGGVGAPRPTDGDMETLWGLRGHPFPGRRAVGAGHARPGGLRGQPSMVRSVGRGLDPSAGGCPGDGRWREVSRGVGDAAPYGLSGNGR